jgi:DNA-binding beta-propeller fold protein YncE
MKQRRGSWVRWIALAGAMALAGLGSPAAAVPTLPTFVGTFAGPGLADMYPVDVALSSTYYYVLDGGRFRVVAVNRATNQIDATVGGHQGKGDSQFAGPRAIASDSNGNVYVADTANHRIQKFDPELNFLTKWGSKGTGPGQFSLNYGVGIGPGKGAGGAPDEVVYVSDTSGGGRIEKFTRTGTFLGQFGAGDLSGPRKVAVDPVTHRVWVLNAGDNTVRVFDQDGDFLFKFGGVGTANGKFLGDPRGLDISGSYVYVSDDGNHRVQVFDTSGNFVAKFGTKGSGSDEFIDPRGLVVTPGGVAVVTDQWDYALKRWQVDPPGSFTALGKLFGTPPPIGGVNGPRGIDVNGSTGQIYVQDWWNNRIQRWSAAGTNPIAFGFRGVKSEPGSLSFAQDLAIQQSTGRVFVANREQNEIEVFDANGGFVTRWGNAGSAPGQLRQPQGLTFSPLDGTLLVADSSNNRIQRFSIDAGGRGSFVASYGSTGSGAGQFKTPTGVSVAPDGTIWVADTINGRVQKRHPATGQWTVYPKPAGGTRFVVPWGVTVAPDGTIWVADSGKDRIVQMQANGTQIMAFTGTQVGAGAFDAPFEVAFSTTGTILVTDVWNNRVVELAP